MAPISINVVSTFLIVLIGSLPCRSHVCTWETANNCRADNIDSTTRCQDHNKTILCFEDQLQNCKDDTLINAIKSGIKTAERRIADCPGLPNGKCFRDELLNNCGMIKFHLTYEPMVGQDREERVKECIEFSGKSSRVRTCTENLKLKCVNHTMLKILDRMLQWIDKAEKVCADFKKSSDH